jgi:signal transduction histidine kinase/DNA-binding response OmpR family regulator
MAEPATQPTTPGPALRRRHASSWFFYFVAAALGVSFSGVLLLLAWDNAVESENRAFAFESLSVDDTARMGLRAAHEAIEAIASFVGAASDEVATSAFEQLSSDLMRRNQFVTALAWYRRDAAHANDFVLRRRKLQVDGPLPAVLSVASELPYAFELRSALESGAVMPVVFPAEGGEAGGYWLVRPVPAGNGRGAGEDLVLARIDPVRLLGRLVGDSGLTLHLFLESEGVGGRKLLYRKAADVDKGQWLLQALSEGSQVRFERYSVRLLIEKGLYWRDLDKGLLFTASILSLGVTLLLIALARAKDLQARELAARNRVIEDQVRRQTHELAEARDQALAASRVKSDFLASMSHEIRTPLNAIIGMAELLSDTRLSTDQARYVGVFRNAGEALLSLVNDILDLSKIEAGQLILEQIDFDLVELIERSADIYALKTAAKGIELTVRIAPDVAERVKGDPARLRQVVLNLVGNAIKFTEQGEINVRVEPAAHRPGLGRIRISVCDTGIGIPVDKQQEIFASFTQVDSSTTRKYGGTGLGLTISRKLVEIMGGQIWVESREGEGSRFHFEIPFGPAAMPEGPGPGPASQPLTALVIDDNDSARGILCDILRPLVTETRAARSAAEAQALVRQVCGERGRLDWIFCDARLPDADGIELARELAATAPESRVVVLLDSTQLGADLERVKVIAGSDFLVKPIKRHEVREMLMRKPADDAAPARLPTPPVAAQDRARLLLVEDNPDNRLLIRTYLKKEAYDVDEAENGAVALACFGEGRYDLILMDVQMPVMDGHEATRAIRDFERASGRKPIPIIALTAHAVKEDMDKSLAAGCTAHLTKPIKKQVLLAALVEHLGGGLGDAASS